MATENLKYVLQVENQDFKRKMNESQLATQKASRGITDSFKNIAGAAKTFIASAVVMSVGQAVASMVKMAEETRVVRTSFSRLAEGIGQDSTRILRAMEKGIGGTVNQLDLMKQANSAILLGIPVTVDKMEQMAETALRLGRAVGRTGKEAMGDLVTGIGRMSPLILDNLGITIKAEEAFRGLGEGATDAQKRMAFFEAVMKKANERSEQLGDVVPSVSEKFATLTTRVSNLAIAMGEKLNPAADLAIGLLNGVLDVLDREPKGGLMKFLQGSTGPSGVFAAYDAIKKAESASTDIDPALLSRADAGLDRSFASTNLTPFMARGGINTGAAFTPSAGPTVRRGPRRELTSADVIASANAALSRSRTMARNRSSARGRDPIDPLIDSAAEAFGKDIPNALKDGMGDALDTISAQMRSFGLKGAGSIFSGIATARSGLAGLGVGQATGALGGLTKALGTISAIGGVVQGAIGMFQGIKSLLGGPSFKDRLKGESDVQIRARIAQMKEDLPNTRGGSMRRGKEKQIEQAEAELDARRETEQVQGVSTSTNITSLTDATGRGMVSSMQTILVELRSGHLNTIAGNTTSMSAMMATLAPAGQATAVVREAQAQGN